ncbi:MAG: ABC-2 family transporter protein [bacterium]|nr:ABC-2 family transporter protein [bacterium]
MGKTLKRYLALTRIGIMEGLQFRVGPFVLFFGNLIYLVIIYFLWKAIYASSPTEIVNGMSFYDTMIYLVLASALFSAMEMFVTWWMGRSVQTGKIVLDILKPMPYDRYMFFYFSGNTVVNFCLTLLPTLIIVYFVTHGGFALSWNLLFFAAAVIFGTIINYQINFIVGTICFYTESVWGINIMKEVVVMLLSGATIPLAFFPEAAQRVMYMLPFQAIYNTPLTLLIHNDLPMSERLILIAQQILWAVVMGLVSKLFFKVSIRHITVNGG